MTTTQTCPKCGFPVTILTVPGPTTGSLQRFTTDVQHDPAHTGSCDVKVDLTVELSGTPDAPAAPASAAPAASEPAASEASTDAAAASAT